MGGRGMVSVTGGTIHIGSLNGGVNDIRNVGGESDNRADIHVMFEDELGFSDVRGLNDLDTAILGAQGIALKNLEREYGALESLGVGSMEVLGMDSASAIAAVRSNALTGKPNALLINREKFSTVKGRNAAQRHAEASGFSMPTDGSTAALARYAITHEYGHIVESALWQKELRSGKNIPEGTHARRVANDIIRIAVNKYGAKQIDLSDYGASNSYEFFAESFANAKSGNPNAFGRAMNDYLNQNRL